MVFRGAARNGNAPYHSGLIVFLVAEQPTGGIDDGEFTNALAWIDYFGCLHPLRILGPTFSGSLQPLQRVLQASIDGGLLQSYKDHLSIQVSSGSVSSKSSIHPFRKWLSQQPGSGPESYFLTAKEDDDVILNRFCGYLNSQGYALNHVAILSEDETAFGNGTQQGNCYDANEGGAFNIYYPRDIATLRSAYEEQSIFSPARISGGGNGPATTLRRDLSEPGGSERDTVHSYSGRLTPLAQESLLQQITSALKHRHAWFIILRSSNPLDQIFLSEFLRRSYPEGRVVIDGGDLLFARGSQGSSLRGVMVLSTYPLITQQQDWTSSLLGGKTGDYQTFAGDTAEGVYIAARQLFRKPARVILPETPILDYAPPAWALGPNGDEDNKRPATWLTVIGHGQFWPLAVLNSHTLNYNGNSSGSEDPLISSARGLGVSLTGRSHLSCRHPDLNVDDPGDLVGRKCSPSLFLPRRVIDRLAASPGAFCSYSPMAAPCPYRLWQPASCHACGNYRSCFVRLPVVC